MRGASRRTGEVLLVSPAESFGWGVAAIATLRHCSLPWYDAAGPPVSLPATPLSAARDLGSRDRLSLVAQFAAHEAFLQFAGLADGGLDLREWAIARKRGADCRLIRVGARATDAGAAPPVLSLIQEFADAIGAPPLALFRQSWARAETAYVEVDEILSRDAAVDLRWMRRSATGEVLSPGADLLREIWAGSVGKLTWSDRGLLEATALLAALDPSATLISAGCEFPLHRYGALAAVDESLPGSSETEAAVAERVAARLAEGRHVVVVGAKIDVGSRRVVEIASALGTATWLFAAERGEVPATRWFVLAPRLAARKALDERLAATADPRPWIESFVESDGYRRYLAAGEVPAGDLFVSIPEPKRSYIAALAFLGMRTPAQVASAFLADFLFEQPLDELCVPGLTRLEGDAYCFENEAVREHCAAHVPAGSRATLCRAAAAAAGDERAPFLLIEAGDVDEGIAILESFQWRGAEHVVDLLSRVLPSSLTPRLAQRLGHAFVDCGRYRDAAAMAARLDPEEQEILLARCDRRAGDYATALARLERVPRGGFEAEILRCELLRVAGRYAEAAMALRRAAPSDDEELVRSSYEGSLLALENEEAFDPAWTSRHHYLAARFLTYRALTDSDFASAEQLARDALGLARSPVERIDAWLDLVFAAFSAGRWPETRVLGLEALTLVEETQGDRAAAGILFTLTYLAADEGHWSAASATLDRLRHYYSSTNDAARLFELKLLEAHLDFCRGRFGEARRLAEQTLEREQLLPQIREAAALIFDEVNAIEHRPEPLRSTGGSGNRELTDRHRLLARRAGHGSLTPDLPFNLALARWESDGGAAIPTPSTRSEELKMMRSALARGRTEEAGRLARHLGVEIATAPTPVAPQETEILRIAATAEFPFARDTFGRLPWAYATRNRLGHWTVDGSLEISQGELDRVAGEGSADWIACSNRELLYIGDSGKWSPPLREAVAAVFRMRAENHRLRRLVEPDEATPSSRPAGAHGIVGESPAIRGVFEMVNRVARRDVAVCILGESGTGKELVARAVHRESSRRHKPFLAVNCAALPENLIESELFGHVRGAFTGADRDRAGLIETCDGGTLFLDEIGEMPLLAQAKLLRFLQDGEFRRVGDSGNRNSDVRIITATNRRLESAVDEGRFREDLYYRVRGVEVPLPPLRDRGGDVLLLARHFLAEERSRHRGGPLAISPDVEALFRSYRWPGNVRELQNTVRAAHAMAGEAREIAIEHLPERLRVVVPARVMAGSYQDAVARFRRDLIEKSLLEAAGNQNRAAALLNMSRQALAYQIRELGILVRKTPARSV
ncbi:MAG TPA: sigma 54-interacting transcriptional regulator [Thermoanaerobaculia bacterium]|nr:sigma 54-interacting transcriptional regulator [Thermoanaerobaculia bacterium]